jgi:hypothetical protein
MGQPDKDSQLRHNKDYLHHENYLPKSKRSALLVYQNTVTTRIQAAVCCHNQAPRQTHDLQESAHSRQNKSGYRHRRSP